MLRQGVQGISDLIKVPGMVNIDFADIRTIMQDAGYAHMGTGKAVGKTKAEEAAKMAIPARCWRRPFPAQRAWFSKLLPRWTLRSKRSSLPPT